jgi:ABC-2 type transport system permease protein
MQLKASFKKELLAFWRTKRFVILTCVFIGWALFSVALVRGMSELLSVLEDNPDVNLGEGFASAAAGGVFTAITELATTALLVFLLLLNSFAGGEQKKRSVIIPRSAGLRSFSYIFPKFIVYPLIIFVLSVLGVLAASGLSALLFENNDLVMSRVLLGGVLLGVYLMMYVSFHLSLGTATGRAGMSAAICIVASFILPPIFQTLATAEHAAGVEAYVYNPFALSMMAAGSVYQVPPTRDIIMTVLITFAIMVIVYFVALFVQNAKRIDNSGNEKLI